MQNCYNNALVKLSWNIGCDNTQTAWWRRIFNVFVLPSLWLKIFMNHRILERPQCIVESDKESLRVSQRLPYLLYSFLEFLNTQIYAREEKVTGSFDTRSYNTSRYKSFQCYFLFTRKLYLKLYIIGIFVQFHCLSSYRNDLKRNDFVSKRPVNDE